MNILNFIVFTLKPKSVRTSIWLKFGPAINLLTSKICDSSWHASRDKSNLKELLKSFIGVLCETSSSCCVVKRKTTTKRRKEITANDDEKEREAKHKNKRYYDVFLLLNFSGSKQMRQLS